MKHRNGFYLTALGEHEIEKDPDDELDYWWNFTDWLTDGDTITAAEVTVEDSATLTKVGNATIHAGALVEQWLSGGTLRDRAKCTCRVTTAGGRTKDKTFYVRVVAH